MMRFERVAQPADFEVRAQTPGNTWLAEHPTNGRPPSRYWKPFLNDLRRGFRELCAYSAMLTPVGSVDHFVSIDEDRGRAFDWTNYRFASELMNSKKRHARSTSLLDPYGVEEGWFEILLPSLQLVATDRIPPAKRAQAEFMLKQLGLRHDERFIRQRRSWYEKYQDGLISLEALQAFAPLIAAAVRKQGDIGDPR
ncbi:MAG: hypothetical protein H6718_07520 [Polyangiaceae bacterium]|nr:hypothetical protein [Polyangiaceae bacterium]MCB9609985.1 hypothetical protein [Polyangiaceae bacterium]